jgi:hypothetical protein
MSALGTLSFTRPVERFVRRHLGSPQKPGFSIANFSAPIADAMAMTPSPPKQADGAKDLRWAGSHARATGSRTILRTPRKSPRIGPFQNAVQPPTTNPQELRWSPIFHEPSDATTTQKPSQPSRQSRSASPPKAPKPLTLPRATCRLTVELSGARTDV